MASHEFSRAIATQSHSAQMQRARSHQCHAACKRTLHAPACGAQAGAAACPSRAGWLPGTRALRLLRRKPPHPQERTQRWWRHPQWPWRRRPGRSPPGRANIPPARVTHARAATAPPTPNHPQQSGSLRAPTQRQRQPPRWMRMSATSRRRMRCSCARRDTSSLKNRTGVLRGERGARE